MNYIEFFDKTATENISACLTYTPERVIFVGDNSKIMKKHIARYEEVFAKRGHKIEFLYKTVSKNNLDNVVEVLTEIVETYDDCVFDITGGEETLSLALGIVYERNRDKNIQIHRFNILNSSICDFDKDGATIFKEIPSLSVEEIIKIYCGAIAYGAFEDGQTCLWDLNDDFIKDIDAIWSICKRNVRLWNAQINTYEVAELMGKVSEDGLLIKADIAAMDNYLSKHKSSYKNVKGIARDLLKFGLLTKFEDDGTFLTIAYKNIQVKRCLTKAGQALEMKMFLTAKNLTDEAGKPVYNDAVNGVVIDWDGEFHEEDSESVYDTENEIDVLLMHNTVPVFVSCKNGILDSDELYKLNTVAERFGGKYAKKILIATSISSIGEAGKYLRQRAKDMNIRIIENVQEFSDEELTKKLKNMWK